MQNIPEERIPAILARAAELDRQTITIDALRAAALEAGIGAAALDQALAEYAAGSVQQVNITAPAQKKRNWRNWLGRIMEPLKLGVLALIVGAIGTRDVTMATVAVCWLIATAGYLAWRDRGAGKPGRFLASTLVMSATMFLGLASVGGDRNVLGYVVVFTIALLLLGTLVVHFGGDREGGEEITAR